ncbi:hypothetical protein NXH76_15070 [Blautia schinkii]|nr:hypothetical protein [Blautia schinkii]
MTKLKNTKKGMAKKALSISLVAAMLATSNVPVWAAEDIFSDNSAAVEAEAPVDDVDVFSSEEAPAPAVADVAPAVEIEETEEISTYNAATSTLALNQLVWGTASSLATDSTLINSDGKEVKSFRYEWLIDGRQPIDKNGVAMSYSYSTNQGLKGITSAKSFTPDESHVGHTLTLKITGMGADEGFIYTTPGVVVKAKTVDETNTGIIINKSVDYTGEEKTFALTDLAMDSTNNAHSLAISDFTYSYEGDNVNACENKSTAEQPKLVAKVNKAGYEGTIKVPFVIWKRYIQTSDYEVKINTKEYAYTGASVTPDAKDVTVTSKLTKETINPELYTVSAAATLTNVGDSAQLKITFDRNALSKDAMFNNNYKFNGNADVDVVSATDDKAKVIARNLSDCTISIDSTKYNSKLSDKAQVKGEVTPLIHIYAGETELTHILNGVDFTVSNIDSNSTSATVTFTGDDKNVKGTATATFRITLNSVTDASFTGGTDTTTGNKHEEEVYTGSPITKKAAQLGKLMVGATTLVEGKEYKVVYSSNNTEAGETVSIYVEGINDWGGRKLIGTFDIIPAEVEPKNITVPKTVEYNGANVNASDYLEGKVTVKATTKVRNDKGDQVAQTIDIPASAYKLAYTSSAGTILPGTLLTTVLTVKDKNFGVVDTTVTADKKTEVVNKSLEADSVTAEVVGGPYVYTGKEIVPTLKVTYDGEELALDRDYEISSKLNNINAGEATITIKGKGDYSGTQAIKFTINKANINDVIATAKTTSKLVFTYSGQQIRPATGDFDIKLGDVDVHNQFTFAYPTSSYNNVNAGKAKVTLLPLKDNKNFEGQKEIEFEILPKEITSTMFAGNFTAWDANGKVVKWNTDQFKYDGTEKTFKEVKFTPTTNTDKLVEGRDYEIKYFNNTTGPEAYVYINGIGNYTNVSTQKFAGSDVTYTANAEFGITGVTIRKEDVVIGDSSYAGGLLVKPNVTITIGGKTLIEGTDYEFVIDSKYDCVNVTPSDKILKAQLKAKGGYSLDASYDAADGTTDNLATFSWKIVAKDIKDTVITATKENGVLDVAVMNGSVRVPSSEYDVKENGDGTITVTAKTTSKNYTGSQNATIKNEDTAIGTPIITGVKVVGNKATVELAGDCDGATGYDYVISTSNDYKNNRVSINKNVLSTTTTFRYTQQGIYYAYLHAWKRVDGKKVFSGWSNIYPFSVSSITPSQPVVTDVKVTGKTVKVTYTKSADATGYDLVLGSKVKKVNGEMRPVEYGKLVKKVYKGNTVTATFTNVPKGTYYAGLHAYNRTSENNGKVFSPWSNTKKVTVK